VTIDSDDSDLRRLVAAQQARLDDQAAELAELRALVAGMASPGTGPAPAGPERHSRRDLIRLAGAAAVGAAGTMLVTAGPAAALDTDPLSIGVLNTTSPNSAATTILDYATAAPRSQTGGGAAILSVRDEPFDVPAAVLGVADHVAQMGVAGLAGNNDGFGVIGIAANVGVAAYGGATGLLALSDGPDVAAAGTGLISLTPHLAVGPPTEGSYLIGDLICDEGGNWFVCVADGTPGTWRKLAGPQSAGAFHAVSPQRVYDSRGAGGKLADGEDRTISVAGANPGAPVVPAGATAVTITLTITDTEGVGGFVAVRPAGTPYAGTSSINWFGPGQNLATTVVSLLGGDRSLVMRGGFQPTNFVVDVTGYYA
jgi:hypothetical protein